VKDEKRDLLQKLPYSCRVISAREERKMDRAIYTDTGSGRTGFPSQHYQLNEAFATEDEADDFALRRAMEWIDQN
jgi:hypothetical protein